VPEEVAAREEREQQEDEQQRRADAAQHGGRARLRGRAVHSRIPATRMLANAHRNQCVSGGLLERELHPKLIAFVFLLSQACSPPTSLWCRVDGFGLSIAAIRFAEEGRSPGWW